MEIDLKRYERNSLKRPPSHELSASVDEIIGLVGINKTYNYGYWLFMVKKSKMKYCDILDLVKKARELDSKYNVGGYITNQLVPKTKKLL
jgi:hypothetical protein